MSVAEQIRKSVEWQMDLPIDQLIELRRQQVVALRAYNAAYDAWVLECSKKRWWQRKPPEPLPSLL